MRETSDGNSPRQIFSTAHLAATDDFLVAAAPFFALGWKQQGSSKLAQISTFFEGIEDIDARGDQVAVLGVHRASDGQIAPEGSLAWVVDLEKTTLVPKSVLRSPSGPGARPMVNCPTFGVGGIRFLPNGSVVVVPGVEAGAYHLTTSGKLLTSWPTEALGIGIDCDFDVQQGNLLSRDPHARWEYLNRFRTVDEILVLDGIPNLVVRRVEKEGTRWELLALEPHGKTSRRSLPVESPSQLAHLRGDVRDGRVVLLVFDESTFLPTRDPLRAKAELSRLIVLEQREKSREIKEPKTTSPSGEPRADPAQ